MRILTSAMSCLSSRGKHDREGRSFVYIRSNAEAAAVIGDDPVTDGEAKAGAFADLFGRKEGFEDL